MIPERFKDFIRIGRDPVATGNDGDLGLHTHG